jgi:hypothetical protein
VPQSKYVGKKGRVTGKIAPGTTGEVILELDPGTNTFHAHPADGRSIFELHTLVQVVSFNPPQTVYVRGDIQDT